MPPVDPPTPAKTDPPTGGTATLTVKGQPINQTQVNTARALLQVAVQNSAPPLAKQACIFDAIFESDLGVDLGPNSAGYGGVLGGATSVFGNVNSSLVAMANSFFQGGNGFQAGGAIAASGKYQNVAVIGSQVTAAIPFDSQGISTQYESQGFPIASAVAEAAAIVSAYDSGAGLVAGGTSGAGGTGTPGNQAATSIWTVGDPSNPDQDYWTTVNQYSMNAQWYCFSDAETLYVADGIQLMAQQPQGIISRLDPAVVHAEATYDNCLDLRTPIPTPDGWTTMGDLKAGDLVFGADGKPTPVLGVSPIHFGRDCYRVEFSDGTSIISDDGHFWETVACRRDAETVEEVSHQRYRGVRTTKQIADTLRTPDGVLNHRIKLAQPLDTPERALPVDPYVLGYWLGDGTCGTPIITVSPEDKDSLVEQVELAGYGHNTRSAISSSHRREFWKVSPRLADRTDTFSGRLRGVGVLHAKQIPSCYKTGSKEQRLALLQGLMDSDGTVWRECSINFVNRSLALDVLELVRSLGFAPTICEKPARGKSRPQTQVRFTTKPHVNVFRLPRKAARYAERLAAKANVGRNYRTVRSVERVASVPVRCIGVGNQDHLFLAGEGMVPTRNTAFQYTSTHKKRSHIQRRTGLARLTSPTQVSIDIICDIDQYRAGDTVVLAMFGPADGTWLIGDCTRSIYSATSSLTLVQAMQPINASTGLPGSTPFLTGKQASQATSGTVMAAMISEAQTITADDYPYVYGGGHKSAGTPDIGIPGGNGYDGHTIGFDCSGAVAAVLAAGGLWPFGGSVGNDASIVQTLLSQNKITPGRGTGRPECTLFDNPGQHIYMTLNGQHFGTSDGDGGNHSQPNGGAGWLYDSHSDDSTFRAYHVPQSILGQQASGA